MQSPSRLVFAILLLASIAHAGHKLDELGRIEKHHFVLVWRTAIRCMQNFNARYCHREEFKVRGREPKEGAPVGASCWNDSCIPEAVCRKLDSGWKCVSVVRGLVQMPKSKGKHKR